MSTTTTTRIDFSAIVAKAPPPKPKTLAECHAEAGCLPFTAISLANSPLYPDCSPKGSTCTFTHTTLSTRPSTLGELVYIPSGHQKGKYVHKASIARWQLVGHKP